MREYEGNPALRAQVKAGIQPCGQKRGVIQVTGIGNRRLIDALMTI